MTRGEMVEALVVRLELLDPAFATEILAALEAAGIEFYDTRTEWAAPLEATEAMLDAAAKAPVPDVGDALSRSQIHASVAAEYRAQRDVHLAEQRAGEGEG
jgi:hypothetical protein